MAYTVSIPSGCKAIKQGNRRVTYCDVTFTGSYAAGGEALTPGDFALKSILYVMGVVTDGTVATGMSVTFNRATGKLAMFESAASGSPGLEKGAEAYAATTVGRLELIGQ